MIAIYQLEDPRTGEVRYIGQTNNPAARLNQHISRPHQQDLEDWIGDLAINALAPRMVVLLWTEAAQANFMEGLSAFFIGGDLLNKRVLPIPLPLYVEVGGHSRLTPKHSAGSTNRRFVDSVGLGTIAAGARAAAGKTQQEVADELGFSRSQISTAESGGNVKAAVAMIEHYGSARVEWPYFAVEV